MRSHMESKESVICIVYSYHMHILAAKCMLVYFLVYTIEM